MSDLVVWNDARNAIAKANSIDEIKDIRDKAEALRQYAKQAGETLEVQNSVAEIKIRAERKAGEILKEMDRAKQGRPHNKPTMTVGYSSVDQPAKIKLADVGISHNQSSRWQQVAAISEEEFEEHIATTKAANKELTSAGTQKLAKKIKKQKNRESRKQRNVELAKQHKVVDDIAAMRERFALHTGDVAAICATMKPESVDVIITDPPYPKEYLDVYELLAKAAARVLKPGGSLVVMVGQSYLPTIIASMSPHIQYHWTLAYLTPGGQSPQIFPRKVNTFWKPLLWFIKGEYNGDWHGDVIKSDPNDNDKRFHHWGQSESGMARIVEAFSLPGQTVLDPFCGGGTTGVVALTMGRNFIGVDVDQSALNIANDRIIASLMEMQNGT